MRLTTKLLGHINRAFRKDPDAFLALRLSYDGGMQWQVAEGVLTTTVRGGSGAPLSIPLAGLTVAELAGVLSVQRGYTTPWVVPAPQSGAAALRLLDGQGDIYDSNGDHLLAYGSILYAYLDAMTQELMLAQSAIVAMPDQMNTATAAGDWLDLQGLMYAVPRLGGEPDGLYARRIIVEVLRPKGNNVAIEAAIADYIGQDVTINDVTIFRGPEPSFDGIPAFDGSYNFSPAAVPVYGLFDAVVGYDLIGGGDPSSYIATLRALVERLRDAGTQLRSVTLGAAALSDLAELPTDDTDTLVTTHYNRFDGSFLFDGSRTFGGDNVIYGTIEEDGNAPPPPVQPYLQVRYGGVPMGVLIELPDGSVSRVLLPH
ncbi:MAG TPA: hypothetical protein VGC15_13090 [Acetobacteraceae bacterium]